MSKIKILLIISNVSLCFAQAPVQKQNVLDPVIPTKVLQHLISEYVGLTFQPTINDWQNVINMAYSPTGKHLALVCKGDTNLYILNAQSWELQAKLVHTNAPLTCVAYSKDGAHIITCDSKSRICVWNAQNFTCQKVLPQFLRTFSKIKTIAPFGQDQILIFDENTRNKIVKADLRTEQSSAQIKNRTNMLAFALTSDNKEIAIAENNDDSTMITALDSQNEDFKGMYDFLEGQDICSLAFSPNGNYVAASSNDSLVLWDRKQSKIIDVADSDEKYKRQISQITFNPNGILLAATPKMLKLYAPLLLLDVLKFAPHKERDRKNVIIQRDKPIALSDEEASLKLARELENAYRSAAGNAKVTVSKNGKYTALDNALSLDEKKSLELARKLLAEEENAGVRYPIAHEYPVENWGRTEILNYVFEPGELMYIVLNKELRIRDIKTGMIISRISTKRADMQLEFQVNNINILLEAFPENLFTCRIQNNVAEVRNIKTGELVQKKPIS